MKVRVSAASKVLVTGGYLIIDSRNEGIVLQTTAKFHCTIIASDFLRIKCPQLHLKLDYPEAFGKNSFIDKCVIFVEKFLGFTLNGHISLEGDNQFYSQRGTEYFPNKLSQQPPCD